MGGMDHFMIHPGVSEGKQREESSSTGAVPSSRLETKGWLLWYGSSGLWWRNEALCTHGQQLARTPEQLGAILDTVTALKEAKNLCCPGGGSWQGCM